MGIVGNGRKMMMKMTVGDDNHGDDYSKEGALLMMQFCDWVI
jgi:hypothetical protein